MRGIESQAAFYRGYLTDDRSLAPLTVALAAIVALWSLVYLVGCFAPAREAADGRGRRAMVLSRGPTRGALTARRAEPNLRGA